MFPRPPFPLRREPTASAPRGDTLSTRIDCYRSLFMSLVRGRKESKLVRSLVLYVKLGVRFSRRLAARVPFLNKHIPCIRTQNPLSGNPNVHIVHELSIKGLCKERSDGRAIVTKSIASNAIRSIVRSGQIFVKLLDNLIKILDPVLLC